MPRETAPKPIWQPLTMLPTLLAVVSGQVECDSELHGALSKACDRPHVLDDASVQRSITLCEEQLEMLPVFREQVDRWRQGSPTRAQREQLAEYSRLVDRHEELVKASLAMALSMEAGTIDAIARLGDGEVALAVLQGTLKPPNSSHTDDGLRLQELRAIAVLLDACAAELEDKGLHGLELLGSMAPQMPLFRRMMDLSKEDELSDLCSEHPALFRFAKLLENLAAGIASGEIRPPG